MKNLKIFAALCCATAALAFTSCDTEDDKGITSEQRATAAAAMKGDYQGRLLCPNVTEPKSETDKTDTLDILWSVKTDSTIVVKSFPVKSIASQVTNDDVKKALNEAPAQDFTLYHYIYAINPTTFLLNPKTLEYTATYGEKEHKLKVVFYLNNNYSYGVYQPASNGMAMQIIAKEVVVDGDTSNPVKLTNDGVALLLTTTKFPTE